ncbi:OSTB protein, partial [Callaeas wilsoni]|nr:OSTB protein [Callaeas wilsoni]
MSCSWGWPHLCAGFFADTEAFLIKNARVKLCIQASLINRKLLPEDCNPESDFQDWSWQDNSLVNCGTQSCLSMVGARECGKAYPHPGVFAALLPHHNGVCSQKQSPLLSAWDQAFCLLGETCWAEHKHLPTTLASTHMYEHPAGNVTLPLGLELEQLEELLWFFRREDPSTWNYSVLALSLVTLILGLVLLTINIVRNRKRKTLVNREGAETTQHDMDAKQALMPAEEYSPAELQKQKPGDVIVQWKDGTVTSLYTEMSEEAV